MNKAAFTPLESERVLLRRFTEADLPPFLAYLNDPLVARYQTWESYTEQQAKDVIEEQKNLEPGVPGRWFTFAVESKDGGLLIGHVALKMQDHQQAEIGFTFSRASQGKGLAFEAAARVLSYVFTELKLHRVIAITDCENEKSIALLRRLGMRREGHFIQNIWFKGKWGDEYLYAILREEWLRERAT
ncbi:MAG TPA: GNAT family protein [Pyrinomonadaceae bacterium]|nr:GNAT family protein [Pyrinomonadaceae bacterium]